MNINIKSIILLLFIFPLLFFYHDYEYKKCHNYRYNIIIPKSKSIKNEVIYNIDFMKKISFILNEEMIIISNYIKKCNYNLPTIVCYKIAYEIYNQCSQEKIPVSLIIGIIQTGSNFNPMSVSNKKARGLMQVLDKTYMKKNINKDELHDIAYNIEYGIKILKTKLKITNNNLDRALYYYVGRSKTYSKKVYKNMAKFIYFKKNENKTVVN